MSQSIEAHNVGTVQDRARPGRPLQAFMDLHFDPRTNGKDINYHFYS